jgi:hypothetical protein
MYRGISAALAIVGALFIFWGLRASRSLGSELTEAVTGAPSDKAIWLLAGGSVAVVLGGIGLLRGDKDG